MHRVRVPLEEVRRKTSRQSIVFFVHPNNDVRIRPLPGFPNTKGLEKYETGDSAYDHVIKRFESARNKTEN